MFNVLLFLHILCAIVGFGSVALAGVHGMIAGRLKGPQGLAVSEAAYEVASKYSRWFIYAVFVFGFFIPFANGGPNDFQETWLWLSIALYVLALAISTFAHSPNLRRMNDLSRELVEAGPPPAGATGGGPPPQAVEMEGCVKRAQILGTVLNLLMVAILALMVWKPGG